MLNLIEKSEACRPKASTGCGIVLAVALGIVVGGCDRGEKSSTAQSTSTSSSSSTPDANNSNATPEGQIVEPQVNWPNFRGTGYRATVATGFPLNWSVDNGIAWQTGLPGRGASSPIVFGDRIYLTAYGGFGLTVKDAGEYRDLRHHLLCFEKATGKPVWQRTVSGTSLKQNMNPELERHGFASSTAVTDGENIYVFFGVTGVFAFDRDGELLWQRNLGVEAHYFGSSASPILYEDLLIVNASIESKTVVGLNKKTGAAVWRIQKVNECWSTPVIGMNADGKPEMVISSKNKVAGYDPATGKELWHCAGIQDYVVSVPVIVDGICYLTGGKEKQTIAVRLGGQGDVGETHKLWDHKKIGSNVSSPVYRDGRLYIVHDSGMMQIVDAVTGELIKRQRTSTKTRPFSSPLLAGDYLYMPFQDAGIAVFRADEECEEVAVNPLIDEVPIMASITPSQDRFYYRTDQFLVCVDGQSQSTTVIDWVEPSDTQTTTTIESWNVDSEKGWSRRYMGFLVPNFEQPMRYLLMPYQSVITDEQTEQGREIILGEKPKYDALRERFEALQWAELQAPAQDGSKFDAQYEALEKETNQLNSATRILVKKLFPPEQMQQHLDDSKAGIGHKKPEK